MSNAGFLSDKFDCAAVSASSNWNTHHRPKASRFGARLARRLPAPFVQNTDGSDDHLLVVSVDEQDISITHLGADCRAAQSQRPHEALGRRSARWAVCWKNDTFQDDDIERFPFRLLIDCAIKDSRADHRETRFVDQPLTNKFPQLRSQAGLVSVVNEPVAESIHRKGNCAPSLAVLRSRCHDPFWREANAKSPGGDAEDEFVEGGVNTRIGLILVQSLMLEMPGLQLFLWQSSRNAPRPRWHILNCNSKAQLSVPLYPNPLASLQACASAGITALRQIRLEIYALSLNAALTLVSRQPVVMVSGIELVRRSHVLETATDAATFACRIRSLATARRDEGQRASRFDAADEACYARRLNALLNQIRLVVALSISVFSTRQPHLLQSALKPA